MNKGKAYLVYVLLLFKLVRWILETSCKDEVGDYNCEHLHDGSNLIKKI